MIPQKLKSLKNLVIVLIVGGLVAALVEYAVFNMHSRSGKVTTSIAVKIK